MRRVVAAGMAMVGMLVFAPGAGAITHGVPDGNGHPEVGALLAQQAFSDGTWEECSGTLISPTRVPDGRALRRGRPPRGGHVRLVLRRTRPAPRTGAPGTATRATTRRERTRRTWLSSCSTSPSPGFTPARLRRGRLAQRPDGEPAVDLGRLRRAVRDQRARAARRSTTRTFATSPRGRLNSVTPSLAPRLPEPLHRERRHLLRRLGRPELPRRGRERDEHRGRHDHRGRHAVPLDERRLPARHAVGARVPRAVRRPALSSISRAPATRTRSILGHQPARGCAIYCDEAEPGDVAVAVWVA